MPAARPVGADLGRGRRRDHHAACIPRRTHAARHRGAMRRLHPAGCVRGPLQALSRERRKMRTVCRSGMNSNCPYACATRWGLLYPYAEPKDEIEISAKRGEHR